MADEQRVERYAMVSKTKEEEDAYDYKGARDQEHPVSLPISFAHLVKNALGAGVLGSHYAYMRAGFVVALIGNALLGMYMCYSLYIIVRNTQTLCRRAQVPHMSYPESAEAAMVQSGRPRLVKYSYVLRLMLVTSIAIHLFGACVAYQITMAKTIKQLVENTVRFKPEPAYPGYPGLRIYILIVLIPCVLLCLIRHLAFLGKFSTVGIMIIAIIILTTIYYAFSLNPSFKNLKPIGNTKGIFEMIGMITFGVSCVGAVLPVENHMAEPEKYKYVHAVAFTVIIGFVFATGICGYAAFLDQCESPITVNFPMTIFPKILKYLLVFMIYFTHALNFWIPFSLVFVYIKKMHKNTTNVVRLELIYRAAIVIALNMIAFLFPSVEAIMGFLGTFSVALEAFTYPHVIEILVYMPRPGYGPFKWRLWKSILFICVGQFIFLFGSYFSMERMIKQFSSPKTMLRS